MDKAVELTLAIKDINAANPVVTITPNRQFFSDAVKRQVPYKHLPSRFAPALEQVGDYVRTVMIPRTFRDEGPGWAPLARRTQRERADKGYGAAHPILQRDRDLFKELTEKTHPKHIEIVRTGKYSRIEIGGSSVKFIQNQLGQGDPGQRLPRRPMIPGTGNLPLDERDRARIQDILTKAITKPS